MRFEGTLTSWNDDRGFGYIESRQGGEPIFVHVSAWPRGSGRPRLHQSVTFEVELGPKGKRAREVRLGPPPRAARPSPTRREGSAQWGTATLFAIPAFLALYLFLAVMWTLPPWVPAGYLALSAATFIAYAADKSAAARGARRTPESTLHALGAAGGWPGALVAQQFLRHKTTKQSFREVFWATVLLNVLGLVVLATPIGGWLLTKL